MQDLFANGFGPQSIIIWCKTPNKRIKSPNVLTIDYDYNIYQTNYKGKERIYKLQKRNVYSISKFLSLKEDSWTESNTFKNF
jgi:hypothetical protein